MGRRTLRLNDALRLIGFALGSEAGARLACQPGMPVSPEMLLRRVRQHHFPDHPIPRVVGVDDWAFHKGHRYRILLVDLERHKPIDLLPD